MAIFSAPPRPMRHCASAVSLDCRNIPRSQQPSPSMGEGLGGGDGAAAKAPQRMTSDPSKPFFSSEKSSCSFGRSRMDQISDTRGSRAAFWRTSPPPNPPPSRGRASGCLALWSLSFAFLAQFCNCILKHDTRSVKCGKFRLTFSFAPTKLNAPLEPRQWRGRRTTKSRQCVEQRLGVFVSGRFEILGKGFPVSPPRISLR